MEKETPKAFHKYIFKKMLNKFKNIKKKFKKKAHIKFPAKIYNK